jgi:hypothetical protein
MDPQSLVVILFVALVVASSLFTALLCLHRTRRKRRIAYTTMFAFPFVSTCAVMFCAAICIDGLSVFTRDYWMGYKAGPEIVFTIYGFIFAVCFLPALCVAVYYKWRSKRDDKSMA